MNPLRKHAPRWLVHLVRALKLVGHPNRDGAVMFFPGHFYSPLLDLRDAARGTGDLRFDTVELWEHVALDEAKMQAFYRGLLDNYPYLGFPEHPSDAFRYYSDNETFGRSDAYLLSSLIQSQRPSRIIEVGSGMSSAVALDTVERCKLATKLTFIEPYPDLLNRVLRPDDRQRVDIRISKVQEVEPGLYDQLEAGDMLFIDSSHVAKVGSDVTFLFLRVLPRLKRGVLVHFHDIFYPFSYPKRWLCEGRAWNESILLRTFLAGNPNFEVLAFNSFAGSKVPLATADTVHGSGGSFWMKRL